LNIVDLEYRNQNYQLLESLFLKNLNPIRAYTLWSHHLLA